MTIYVVLGCTGEYSDQRDWPVRAYRDEAAAQAEVVRLDAAAHAFGTQRTDDALQAHRDTYDPHFDCDYTGTHYFIYSVELVDA